jgi:hypothetical protein
MKRAGAACPAIFRISNSDSDFQNSLRSPIPGELRISIGLARQFAATARFSRLLTATRAGESVRMWGKII